MKSKQSSMPRSGTSTTSRISSDILSSVAVIASVGIACGVLFIPTLAQAQQRPPQAQPAQAQAQQQTARPNILVIFGDDVGQSNISAYAHGLVGYKTPNIDRIAREGMMFTDYYAENSCTAGRSTFITGQVCLRTGLCKVGIPGATVGLQDRDITIAQALKPLGYATGQFGKNHLGDRDEFLPTKHGFDEFFGNLYHLNAEEEPERPYYPKNDADFVKANSPRGVLKSSADGKIEDTGPLNRKRMETIDDETTAAAIDFMTRQARANRPFFTWMNTTRMHAFTHVRESMRGQSGMPGNEYADGMIEHDGDVGKLLKAVDDLGIANDTIVVYINRQRAQPVVMAGRRDNAIPQREGHQLGRCFPCAGDDPLAGPDQGRRNLERYRFGPRLVPHAARGCGRYKYQGSSAHRREHRRQDLQGASGWLQPVAIPDRSAAEVRSHRVLLFQRRRERGRVSLQRLEGRVL